MSDLSLLELIKFLASSSSAAAKQTPTPSSENGRSDDKNGSTIAAPSAPADSADSADSADHARSEDTKNAYEAFIRRHEERVKKIRSDGGKTD